MNNIKAGCHHQVAACFDFPFQSANEISFAFWSKANQSQSDLQIKYIKKPRKYGVFSRRGWDSNPRALSDKRFSRPPRYDHFATPPSVILCFLSAFYLSIHQIFRQYPFPALPRRHNPGPVPAPALLILLCTADIFQNGFRQFHVFGQGQFHVFIGPFK